MVLLTPNGLPQRMQQNGGSSLRMRGEAVATRKSSCGLSVMTFSGQVALHSPHCTQASSPKRSIGCSALSVSAPVGHAETQARQSVQPATSISTAPNGASSGSATTSTGAGAARCSSRSAMRRTPRLPPVGRKVAGRGDGGIGGMARRAAPRASGSSVSMVPTRSASEAEPMQDRLGQRQGAPQARHVMARTRAQQEAHGAGAVGERRGDCFETDLCDLVDGDRQNAGMAARRCAGPAHRSARHRAPHRAAAR